jgi:hypothetical protein
VQSNLIYCQGNCSGETISRKNQQRKPTSDIAKPTKRRREKKQEQQRGKFSTDSSRKREKTIKPESELNGGGSE